MGAFSPLYGGGSGGGGSGAPTDATYITQTANGSLSAEQALSALATGILKNTTATGVLSIAVAGTDYVAPSSYAAGIATFLGAPSSANLAAALTDETGTGAAVFANTPTLVSPLLGTPTSGVLTNCTGLPLASITGFAANVATFLATPSSANLAAAVTDETGSGALVLATSPTLVTPNIGVATGSGLLTITQASANAGILASTGYSLTGSNATSMVDLAGTLNTTGAPTVIKLNVTHTNSDVATKIIDLQVGSTSIFSVVETAAGFAGGDSRTILGKGGGNNNAQLNFGGQTAGSGFYGQTTTNTVYTSNNVISLYFGTIGLNLASTLPFSWAATADASASGDTFITRLAAATIKLGAADAASPIAQTLATQGSRTGTDLNVGGAHLTIQSGLGTGTGTVSTLRLNSPIAVGGGTGVQTSTTGLTIKAGTAVLTSYTVANLPAAATAGAGATAFVTDASTTLILGLGGTVTDGGANKVPVYSDGTNWIYG